MIRPLVIDEEIKAAAAKVIEYAAHHNYIVGETSPPGDDPFCVLKTQFGYRCVFSFTRAGHRLFRDLSVSVGAAKKGKYPNALVFYAIASDLFGFTGWDHVTLSPPPADWMIAKDIHYPAIRVTQQIEE